MAQSRMAAIYVGERDLLGLGLLLTLGINYLINGKAKGLGDMIDESIGTFEMYTRSNDTEVNYPIFNIDVGPCDEELFVEIFFDQPVFFDDVGKSVFNKHHNRSRFVDSNGRIFQAMGLLDQTNWVRGLLRLKRKYEFVLTKRDVMLDFEQVKEKYINSISGFTYEDTKRHYLNMANSCINIKELLGG